MPVVLGVDEVPQVGALEEDARALRALVDRHVTLGLAGHLGVALGAGHRVGRLGHAPDDTQGADGG